MEGKRERVSREEFRCVIYVRIGGGVNAAAYIVSTYSERLPRVYIYIYICEL